MLNVMLRDEILILLRKTTGVQKVVCLDGVLGNH